VIAEYEDAKEPTTRTITVAWNDQHYNVQIEGFLPSPYPDLALLYADELPDHPCVYLDSDVRLEDKLYSYGYVTGYEEGAAADFTYEGPAAGTNFHQLKFAQARPGLSGAPLINRRTGAVSGVVKRTRSEFSDLGGYAIPTATVLSNFGTLVSLQKTFHQRDKGWNSVAIAARGLTESFQNYFDALRGFSERLPYSFLLESGLTPGLSQIYIEQTAKGHRSPESGAPGDADKLEEARHDSETPQDALIRNTHLVFEGGPGVGKSSLVSHLTWERVEAWEHHSDASLVPVPVFARELAAKEEAWSSRLHQQIIEQLSSWLQKDLPGDFFERPPAPGASWLVMVDGLDEVVGQGRRSDLVDTIRHLARVDSQGQTATYRFVATTRPLSVVELLQRDGFARFTVRPFEAGQLQDFAKKWFSPERGADSRDAQKFLQQVEQSRIADLAQVPLLLTMAAVLYENGRDPPLPTSRTGLYEEFVRVLLLSGEAQRETAESLRQDWGRYLGRRGEDWADNLFYERRTILERLALWQQEGGAGSLVEEATRYARQKTRDLQQPHKGWLRDQMLFLLQRTGLISQYGKEERFIHETFREYFAASALARRYQPRDDDAWPYLGRWADKEWREIILFLLGMWSEDALDLGSRDVSDILMRISGEAEGGLLFAGAALAEGVRARVAVEDGIVDRLLASAHTLQGVESKSGRIPSPNPVEVLQALKGRERVVSGLRALGTDSTVPLVMRAEAASALLAHDRASDAESVLRSTARWDGAMWTVEALIIGETLLKVYERCYWEREDEHIIISEQWGEGLESWAKDSTIHPSVRLLLVRQLREWGLDYFRSFVSDLESRGPWPSMEGDALRPQ